MCIAKRSLSLDHLLLRFHTIFDLFVRSLFADQNVPGYFRSLEYLLC